MQNMSIELNEHTTMLNNLQERAGESWLVHVGPAHHEISFELKTLLGEDCMRQAGHLLVDSIVNHDFTGSFICDVQKVEDDPSLFIFAVRASQPVDERLADALSDSTPENCS